MVLKAQRSHTLQVILIGILFMSQCLTILKKASAENVDYGNSTKIDDEVSFNDTDTNEVIILKSEISDLQSSVAPPLPVFEDDDMSQWTGKEWLYKKELKGYMIVSNDLRFLTKLLHRRKILKIRIPLSSARITEITLHRRDVEIKTTRGIK